MAYNGLTSADHYAQILNLLQQIVNIRQRLKLHPVGVDPEALLAKESEHIEKLIELAFQNPHNYQVFVREGMRLGVTGLGKMGPDAWDGISTYRSFASNPTAFKQIGYVAIDIESASNPPQIPEANSSHQPHTVINIPEESHVIPRIHGMQLRAEDEPISSPTSELKEWKRFKDGLVAISSTFDTLEERTVRDNIRELQQKLDNLIQNNSLDSPLARTRPPESSETNPMNFDVLLNNLKQTLALDHDSSDLARELTLNIDTTMFSLKSTNLAEKRELFTQHIKDILSSGIIAAMRPGENPATPATPASENQILKFVKKVLLFLIILLKKIMVAAQWLGSPFASISGITGGANFGGIFTSNENAVEILKWIFSINGGFSYIATFLINKIPYGSLIFTTFKKGVITIAAMMIAALAAIPSCALAEDSANSLSRAFPYAVIKNNINIIKDICFGTNFYSNFVLNWELLLQLFSACYLYIIFMLAGPSWSSFCIFSRIITSLIAVLITILPYIISAANWLMTSNWVTWLGITNPTLAMFIGILLNIPELPLRLLGPLSYLPWSFYSDPQFKNNSGAIFTGFFMGLGGAVAASSTWHDIASTTPLKIDWVQYLKGSDQLKYAGMFISFLMTFWSYSRFGANMALDLQTWWFQSKWPNIQRLYDMSRRMCGKELSEEEIEALHPLLKNTEQMA